VPHGACARARRGRIIPLPRAFPLARIRALSCGVARVASSPPRRSEAGRCVGPLFGAFEMRALLAGTRVSSPRATHLSCHVRGRSLWHSRCARSLRGRSFLRLLRPASLGMRIAVSHYTGSLQCVAGRVIDCNAPPEPAEGRCVGPLFGAFEMRALLAGTLVSSPPATHLSWHVRGRSLGHSRCARSLRGRSFLRLVRAASLGMRIAVTHHTGSLQCVAGRVTDCNAPPEPAEGRCVGPLFGAFEMRAVLAGTLVSSPRATRLSWHAHCSEPQHGLTAMCGGKSD